MVLKKILNVWFSLSLILVFYTFLMALNGSQPIRFSIVFINLVFVFGFYFIIRQHNAHTGDLFFNLTRLMLVLGVFSFFLVIAFKLIYFSATDNFFEFSAKDSLQYDEWAKWMSDSNIIDSVKQYFNRGNTIDDLGAALVTTIAYYIYPSTFMFNIFNIVAGLITAASLYKISLNFTDKKYAYLMALSYGLSSFVIYLYSTGMKEVFFTMFVVLFYSHFIKFWKNRKISSLITAILFLSILILFRPVVMIMIIFSIAIGLFLQKGKVWYSYVLLILLVGLFIAYYSQIMLQKEVYYRGAEFMEAKAYNQNLSPNILTYSTAVISSIIGPLPTYHPLVSREQTAFYSIGLGFRVLLSGFFLFNILRILKNRNFILIAIVMFTLIEMLSLALVLESFELRLNSPHMPFVYLISFHYLYELNTKQFTINKVTVKILKLSFIFLPILIFFWNLRL